MNANNTDRQLRANPATSTNTSSTGACVAAGTCRLDATPEYYMAAKDQRSIIEPGYTLGGALWKDKLWLFSSYIPSIDTTRRLTNFTGPHPGPRLSIRSKPAEAAQVSPKPPRSTDRIIACGKFDDNSGRRTTSDHGAGGTKCELTTCS